MQLISNNVVFEVRCRWMKFKGVKEVDVNYDAQRVIALIALIVYKWKLHSRSSCSNLYSYHVLRTYTCIFCTNSVHYESVLYLIENCFKREYLIISSWLLSNLSVWLPTNRICYTWTTWRHSNILMHIIIYLLIKHKNPFFLMHE